MPTTYRRAPEVEQVADHYIGEHHRHLINERIVYIFRSEPQILKGEPCFATAGKKGGLDAWLIADALGIASDVPESYFLMQVWEQGWKEFTENQREALVDHELAHMGIEFDEKTDEEKRMIRPHDLEEFECIIMRHGLWLPNRAAFARVCMARMKTEQMALGLEDDPTDTALHEAIEGIRNGKAEKPPAHITAFAKGMQKQSDRDGLTCTIESGGSSVTFTPNAPMAVETACDPDLLSRVLAILPSRQEISRESIKREFSVGGEKAAAVVAELERRKLVGPSENGRPRKVPQ